MDHACTIFTKLHVGMLASSCTSMVCKTKIWMLHLEKCNFKTQEDERIKQSIGTKGNSLF